MTLYENNKEILLNDLFNEGWNNIKYYQFMKSLTKDEIVILTGAISTMGYYAYFYGDDYVFNPILLSFISLFIKKLNIIEHDYYRAIRFWIEFDEIPNEPKDFLTQLLIAMDPNNFTYRSEKIFI
jgi:hypothetical protein